jgi:hypothetical protein
VWDKTISTLIDDIAEHNTAAMRLTVEELKQALRAEVRAAGLGDKLALTWRSETYPKGKNSLSPGGFVWSAAPDILESYILGATVVPVLGSRYLAIPTDAVPHARGRRGKTRRMTPFQVESEFNQDLIFRKGKNGHVLAFVKVIGARSGRGFRPVTAGRVKQGRQAELVLMFTLVKSVRIPKLIDLVAQIQRAESKLAARLAA